MMTEAAFAVTDAVIAKPPPHITFILVDDLGSADSGYRQDELKRNHTLKTPTLDALANEGVKLSSYYVQHICSPTRTALLSARYQIHTGLQDCIIQAWARVCATRLARSPR